MWYAANNLPITTVILSVRVRAFSMRTKAIRRMSTWRHVVIDADISRSDEKKTSKT